MDIEWKCNECGQRLTTDDSYSGKEITCPTCKCSLVIPSTEAKKEEKVRVVPIDELKPFVYSKNNDAGEGAESLGTKKQNMFCRGCGKELKTMTNVCLFCGMNPLDNENYCQECGKSTNPKQVICMKCGIKLLTSPKGMMGQIAGQNIILPSKPPKNPILAFFLSLVVAGAGQYYLGQKAKGVAFFLAGIIFGLGTFGVGLLAIMAFSALDALNIGKKLDSGNAVDQWEFSNPFKINNTIDRELIRALPKPQGDNYGKIILIRLAEFMVGGEDYLIFINDYTVDSIREGFYKEYKLSPGTYNIYFQVIGRSSNAVQVKVNKGETKYIKIRSKIRVTKSTLYETTQRDGQEQIKELKQGAIKYTTENYPVHPEM